MAISRGAAFDYLERMFDGPLRAVEATHTVGVTALNALGMDGESVMVVLVNLGVTTIYVAPSNAVATTRGIRLGPSGGLAAFSVAEDGLLSTLDWWAIGDGAGGTLYTLRVRRETRTSASGGT